MPQDEIAGLSRRQMLRRGVAVGSVAWTVPTITAISLTPANAASPSGEPPTEPPPKPPEKPPTTPEQPPTQPPTTPPDDETPKPKPPAGETPKPRPPAGETPAPKPPPGDDDHPVGGSELPDTGAGDVARTVTVGGLLAAGGAAALYAASRENGRPVDGPDQGAPA